MNSMNSHSALELRQSENQVQAIQERVTRFEKQFGDLCTEFSGYTRRTAKLRDNGDTIAKILHEYASAEPFNQTMSVALKKFAEHMSGAEDYRSVEAERLFAKVITPLSAYGEECKHIKTNIRNCHTARKKEIAQSKKNQQSAQTEHARAEAFRRQTELEQQTKDFELKKLSGIKSILSDFVQIELLWHAKALEIYTQAFNDLQLMDSQEDMEYFMMSLKESSMLNSRTSLQHRSASHSALPTTSAVFSTGNNQGGTFPRVGGGRTTATDGHNRPPLPRTGSLPGVNTGSPGTSTGIKIGANQPHTAATLNATKPKVTINGQPHRHDDEFEDDDDEEGSDEFETTDDEEDYTTTRSHTTTPRR